MSPNPFLRGYDKLSIQLILHDLQPGSTWANCPTWFMPRTRSNRWYSACSRHWSWPVTSCSA